MRKPIIAGNWKMNNTPEEATALLNGLKPLIEKNTETEAVVCVPAILIETVKNLVEGSNIHLGAQNVHWEESGAFTGEISPIMLNAFDVEYVIIGHSERRQYFGETDETGQQKGACGAGARFEAHRVCGRNAGPARRGRNGYAGVFPGGKKRSWASTAFKTSSSPTNPFGPSAPAKPATPEEANRVCGIIREKIGALLGKDAAESVRIQYGGSMKPANVADLMAQPPYRRRAGRRRVPQSAGFQPACQQLRRISWPKR